MTKRDFKVQYEELLQKITAAEELYATSTNHQRRTRYKKYILRQQSRIRALDAKYNNQFDPVMLQEAAASAHYTMWRFDLERIYFKSYNPCLTNQKSQNPD